MGHYRENFVRLLKYSSKLMSAIIFQFTFLVSSSQATIFKVSVFTVYCTMGAPDWQYRATSRFQIGMQAAVVGCVPYPRS
jgi:hypothetical protein